MPGGSRVLRWGERHVGHVAYNDGHRDEGGNAWVFVRGEAKTLSGYSYAAPGGRARLFTGTCGELFLRALLGP